MMRFVLLLVLIVSFAFGQITPIADIQFVADPSSDDASPLLDQAVTISGVVTAEYWGSYKNRTMYVQDADTAWSGIYVFNLSDDGIRDVPTTYDAGSGRTTIVEGDSVTIWGVVEEYFNVTELLADSIVVHGPAANPPAPMVLTTAEAALEKYEGCLVRIEDVTVANPDEGNGEWSITDGATALSTNDVWQYYYKPVAGAGIASITGVMEWTWGARKILPRLARDIVQAGDIARVQRIQQVLGSTLYRLPNEPFIDTSLYVGDTLSFVGIVTVPTSEISGWDTTNGVLSGYSRFIWEDLTGGPYSALLSYFNDATAFPALFVGDTIDITGYIFEYAGGGGPAQFTELFITEPVSNVRPGPMPARPTITTGELRDPLTAEMWENNMVRIENAVMIDNNLPYGEFTIDDGTGVCMADGDATNSMSGEDVYGNDIGGEFVRPPAGTNLKSIEGYVYHAYGSFEENTTYSIRPFVPSDVILGGGPPSITNFEITESALGLTDAVTISANMSDKSDVASAEIMYRVDGSAWTPVVMTADGADTTLFTGTIPATNTEGAFVEYYLVATDDGGDNQDEALSTTLPPDTELGMYGYHTRSGGPTIHDLQMTPFASGNSYYVGQIVSARGIVTGSDTRYGAGDPFSIQSEPTKGYGILCVDTSGYVPQRGDDVTVKGLLIERYDEATAIVDIQSVTVHSSGNEELPVVVTGTDLATNPEEYESNFVALLYPVTVKSVNRYDWTVNDGTDDFLIDDDWAAFGGAADTTLDGLKEGDPLSSLWGVWNHSFGTYKVQIRDLDDMTGAPVATDIPSLPTENTLSQNYPNPFNPSTTIEYSLANTGAHSLKVYNMKGALVQTLSSGVTPAGSYSIKWDASHLASGLYFVRLETQEFNQTRKLLLVK
jgi:hypothetical protein